MDDKMAQRDVGPFATGALHGKAYIRPSGRGRCSYPLLGLDTLPHPLHLFIPHTLRCPFRRLTTPHETKRILLNHPVAILYRLHRQPVITLPLLPPRPSEGNGRQRTSGGSSRGKGATPPPLPQIAQRSDHPVPLIDDSYVLSSLPWGHSALIRSFSHIRIYMTSRM